MGTWFIVLATGPDTAGQPSTDGAALQQRVALLHERVTELAGANDLLDTLYFGWADRPYARATLAILVRAASTLEREMDRRERRERVLDDATVESMLLGSGDAAERVVWSQSASEFRPHRVRVTWPALLRGDGPPLIAFVDAARLVPGRNPLGDLDVLASLGQRVYMRPLGERASEADLALIARRAESLGMAVASYAPLAWEGAADRDLSGWPLPTSRPDGRAFVALAPLTLLHGAGRPAPDNSLLPAVMDPPAAESLPASLARRALLRGVLGGPAYASGGWTSPVMDVSPGHRLAAIRASLWVQAFEGQRLVLVETWRDAHEENAAPTASAFTDPAQAETIAHTALDFLRLAPFLTGFDDAPLLALVIGRDALAFDRSIGGEENVHDWAAWTIPVWSALWDRQIRFDLLAAPAVTPSLPGRYRVTVPLDRPLDGDVRPLIERIERKLAQVEDHVYRLTARELDGTIARRVYVRPGLTREGKTCAAVVNLSDEPRVVKLRGRPGIGAGKDVIADEPIVEPDQRLELAAWQVRLLCPSE